MKPKKILIMGASSGIGLELFKLYQQRDLVLGIAARNESVLQQLAQGEEGRIHYAKIDICTEQAPEQLQELIDRMGGLDLYIHSSGQGYYNPELDPEKELATVRCNAEGFVRCIDKVFDYFAQHGGGQIAAISSIAGTKGLGAAPAYSSTKRFQRIYLQSLQQLHASDACP